MRGWRRRDRSWDEEKGMFKMMKRESGRNGKVDGKREREREKDSEIKIERQT